MRGPHIDRYINPSSREESITDGTHASDTFHAECALVLKRMKKWLANDFRANVYYDGSNTSLNVMTYTYQLQREPFNPVTANIERPQLRQKVISPPSVKFISTSRGWFVFALLDGGKREIHSVGCSATLP